jgi:Icc-related predicted phosphoesterase
MKIQIISDLHQEFGCSILNFENADVIIFAGDVNIGVKGIEWLKSEIPDKPVIYVLGNHEYYKGTYPKTLNKIIEAAKDTNIHVLENKCVTIDGVNFHGATLWTDFSLYGNPRYFGSMCQSIMNDYKKIRRDPSYSKLRTIDTFNIHQKSMIWLEKSLIETKGEVNIVVTHHAPSIKSIPEKYIKDPVSSAYASNLEGFIEEHKPKYWIHGHIHEPKRYMIDSTEVICNPHGYIDEKYNGYEKELIVEVKN